jgi:hypothetical protein
VSRLPFFKLLLLLALAGQMFAAPVYVGSFEVDDGPNWNTVPPAYTGQEAAALIFGGTASDYWISVDSSLDPATITRTAWYSTYAGACGSTFPCGTVYAEDYVHNSGGLYQGSGDVSAYVWDWAQGAQYTNYVWTAESGRVPEPGAWTLMGAGLVALAFLRQKIHC